MAQDNWWDAAPVVTAPKSSGPLPSPPKAPKEPKEPKTTWRTLSPDEVKAQGLPPEKAYQISSEGKVDALPTADTKATVDQQKIATLLTRIAGGFSDIQNVTKNDPGAQEPGFIETVRGGLDPQGFTGPIVRGMAGADRRQVYDAQVDVLDALLTLGTGAAYNKEQLAGQTTSYFPQYNDTQAEKDAKNTRLLRLIEAAKANAGPAWDKVAPAIAPYMQGIAPKEEKKDDTNPFAGLPGKVQGSPPDQGNPFPGVFDENGNPLPPDGGPGYDAQGNYLGMYTHVTDDTPDERPTNFGQGVLEGIGKVANNAQSLMEQIQGQGLAAKIASGISGERVMTPSEINQAEMDAASHASPYQGSSGGRVTGEIIGTLPTLMMGNPAAAGGVAGALTAGDVRDPVSLGASTLTGAALGKGLDAAGGVVGRMMGRGGREAANIDREVIAAGERQGVPIRQPDARPELRGKYAQVETTEAGGPLIRSARAEDMAALEGRVEKLGGDGAVADPYAMGQKLQSAGERYIVTTKAQAGKLYDKARNLSAGKTVIAKNADAALDANIQELRAAGENSNASAIKYLEGLRSDIDRGLTVDAVQNLRTNMRGQLSERGLTGTDTERRIAQVIDAMNSDLTEQLPQEASQALRAADNFYRKRQEFIKGTLKEFMGDRGTPLPAETAAKRLVSMTKGGGNYDKFSRMWGQLDDAERADAQATIAASLGRRLNGDFSAAELVKSLDPAKGLNPRTAKLVFGEKGFQALQDLKTIAKAKVATASEVNNSRTGTMVNAASGGLKTMLMGALGFTTAGPGGAAAGAVGRKLLADWGEKRAARMLLNPTFTKWMKNAPASSDPGVITGYIEKLGTLGGAAAANDNQVFVNAIKTALSESPTRAVASEDKK